MLSSIVADIFNFSDGSYFQITDFLELHDTLPPDFFISLIFLGLAVIIWHYDEKGYALTGYLLLVGILSVMMMSEISIAFGLGAFICVGLIFYRIFKGD